MAKKRSGKAEKERQLQNQLVRSFGEARKQYGEDAVIGVLSQKFENVQSPEDIDKAIFSLGKSLGSNGLGRLQQCLRNIDREFANNTSSEPLSDAQEEGLSVREQLRQGLLIEKDSESDTPQCA